MEKVAVFLDRDGVLTRPVLDRKTDEYEPARHASELKLMPNVIVPLKKLIRSGYELFLVSNQPDYAKGKATLKGLKEAHRRFDQLLRKNNINFRAYYYCYHHPNGIVPAYSYKCDCRKPKPFFIIQAARKYGIYLKNSWMVGDRDTDVECGRSAGTKTILVQERTSAAERGKSHPTYKAKDLKAAADIILKGTK